MANLTNYIIVGNSTTTYCLNKSDLSTVSSYGGGLYPSQYTHKITYGKIQYFFNINDTITCSDISMTGGAEFGPGSNIYIASDTVALYTFGSSAVNLYKIVDPVTGIVFRYFANNAKSTIAANPAAYTLIYYRDRGYIYNNTFSINYDDYSFIMKSFKEV